MKLQSTLITNPADILELAGDCDVVVIDEVQFFGPGIVAVADALAISGKRVIIAGLDLDFAAQPFSHVSELLAIAEYIEKTLTICVVCGIPASRSQRLLAGGSERIVVGDVQAYEARCRKCFSPTPV